MKNELYKALEKGIKKDETIKLTEGRHNVSGLIRVNGQLVVGKATAVKPTCSIMSVDFMLLALHMAGVTRESAIAAIGRVAEEYLTGWTGSGEDKDKAIAAREEMINKYDPEGKVKEMFGKMTDNLPKVPRAGSVKFEGHIEEVTVAELEEENNVVEIGVKIA